MFKHFLKIGLVTALTIVIFVGGLAFAAEDDELYQQYLDKQKQIQELSQKISSSQGQQKTLSSTISYLDNKIALAQLEIEQTEHELKILETEIATLIVKISRLDTNLSDISKLLISRVGETYKRNLVNPRLHLLAIGGLTDFLERDKYLQVVQQNDRKVLLELQEARDTNQLQKDIKVEKQAEQITLQDQLRAQNVDLITQKAGKQELLEVTRNDEKRFQALLAAVQADLTSIANALAGGAVKIGPVTTNNVIGVVGSSGCSTGPHLHFEVFTNATVNSSGALISGNRVNPQSYLESSSYKKPVPNYPGNVTTWYGQVYFLGTHSGIDIANSFGTPIYPMADGIAYFVSSPCPYNISGGSSVGKGILVDHQNGLASLYWHIP
jgi:peptidoglycan hydrolase CwlO-like protein